MELIEPWLRQLPLPLRWSLVTAAVTAMVGAVVGLVLGLLAYPPTAWFAVIEVGLPAGILGAVVGLITGAIMAASRRGSQ
ncbi:MAG: hypothetical protein ABIQ15_06810 [Nocardioides sp.]